MYLWTEWLRYMASKEVDAFTPQITADICTYWSDVSVVTDVTGSKMFHISPLPFGKGLSHNYSWECCGQVRVLCKHSSSKRMSLDETTIQALRLVKETTRLHGRPTAVPVTWSMINAVRHAHKKETTQTAKNIEIARKKQRI